MADPLQFIRNDKASLEQVVDLFKSEGFKVFLTGSALERSDYNDIDLVITGQKKIPDKGKRLLLAIDTLQNQYEAEFQTRDENKKSIPHGCYMITARYVFTLDGTKFDVFYTQKPFELNPEAERFEL